MGKNEILACLNKLSLARLRRGVEKRHNGLFFGISFALILGLLGADSAGLESPPNLNYTADSASLHAKESMPALIGLASALISSNQREEGLSILNRLINNTKGSQKNFLIERLRVNSKLFLTNKTFEIYQDGLNLLIAKKYRNAKERFERALTEEPGNVTILVRLGQSMIFDTDFENATARLKTAKSLNPYEPEVKLWLGRGFHLRGLIKEALSELKLANEEMQSSELSSIWLAEALMSAGQAKDLCSARKTLKIALKRPNPKLNAPNKSDHEIGFNPITFIETKSEIQRLIQHIKSRIGRPCANAAQ